MNSTTATTPCTNTSVSQPWRGIFFRGPQMFRRINGKEVPAWNVYQGDDQGRPAGTVYQVTKFERADKLAHCMAHDRCLELINEAFDVADAA